MKYMLIAKLAVDQTLSDLAATSGVAIMPPPSGWHLTVLPACALNVGVPVSALINVLARVTGVTSPRHINFDHACIHPEGIQDTWVVSLGIDQESASWLQQLAIACVEASSWQITEPPTIYPGHLSLRKKLTKENAQADFEAIRQRSQPLQCEVMELELVGKSSGAEHRVNIATLPLWGQR